MKDVLISIIGEDASNEVINQFNVIVTFTPYLIDERINSPLEAINKVRDRVGVPHVTEANMRTIEDVIAKTEKIKAGEL